MPRPHRSILVFEPGVDGHPKEWLQHLIRAAADQEGASRLHLVVAAELARDLAEDQELSAADTANVVRIHALHPAEQAACVHPSLLMSAFARWWIMRRYMVRTGAEAGHFLSIDHLALPLALGFGIGHRPISGVLFRPSNHYGELGPYRPTRGERLRDLRKHVLYRLMLRNPNLDAVLTLDPYFPAFAARHYRHGDKVRWLPDPVHPAVNERPDDCDLIARIPAGRKLFALFGHITERKGILVLLAALRGLRPEIAATMGVILAGRLDKTIAPQVHSLLASLARERPELWVHLEDRRLSDGELSALVRRADLVLAPYHRFVGSSGVLLWAARAGKPIITQDFGLLGRLVRDNQLGLVVDTDDPGHLCAGIERAATADARTLIDHRKIIDLLQAMTPERFANDVFASLLHA